MQDGPLIPDDLPSCQQLLRDSLAKLFASETQFEQACTTSEALHAKVLALTLERDELQLTIERLLHRLYGRRSERHTDATRTPPGNCTWTSAICRCRMKRRRRRNSKT